jgi:prepilin-type processing-associated H-X9-DG protein
LGRGNFSGSPDNTNQFLLTEGKLGSYLQNASVYQCPSDKSTAQMTGGQEYPRVRSTSMNSFMGVNYRKIHQLNRPTRLFIFTDEHPDSIDDGSFAVDLERGNSQKYRDFPAAYHSGRGTFSFADGHVELHKWLHPDTKQPIKHNGEIPKGKESPNNVDITWMQDRSVVPDVEIPDDGGEDPPPIIPPIY